MILEFPNTPDKFRNFWETLARLHANIQHNPENKIDRFFEFFYLDFPYEDWDLKEFTDSTNARIALNPSTYPEAQAMAIMTFEIDGSTANIETVPVSLMFFKVPRSTNTKADHNQAKRECFEKTMQTARSFKNLVRKYFKANTEYGTLDYNSFRFAKTRMPDSTNAMYGMRLDFRYTINTAKCHHADEWLTDPLA